MGHNPVNHPLRPVYRALGGFTGLYFVVFGVVGLIQTAGDGLFSPTPAGSSARAATLPGRSPPSCSARSSSSPP